MDTFDPHYEDGFYDNEDAYEREQDARAGYAAFREEEERAEAAFMEQLQREDEEAWEDEEPWEGETEDEFFDNADDDFSY